MGKVVVINGISLDGVMQAPGRPDEDTRDGFPYGGWAVEYSDDTVVAKMGERGGPFKDAFNDIQKFVASSNPQTKLEWPNSTLLHGDVPAAVAELKQSSDGNLVILGSGVLIASLIAADVIDEYLLTIAPVVLGTGKRLFAGGTHAALRLVDSSVTSKGVLIAAYERARA
jgi:dihydrofolate reductase